MSQRMMEKSAENQIWAKGNDSRKSWPNVIKLKLDLCYMKTKFIYKISSKYLKGWRRKVRKTKFEQMAITDVNFGQT